MRGRPGAGEQPGSARDNARVSGRGPLPSRMAFRLVVGLMLLLLAHGTTNDSSAHNKAGGADHEINTQLFFYLASWESVAVAGRALCSRYIPAVFDQAHARTIATSELPVF